jgi:hypothetical protein
VEGKCSLDANTIARLSQSDVLCNAAILSGNANALKNLETLFSTFTNLGVGSHGVSWLDIWEIVLQKRFGNAIQQDLLGHNGFLLPISGRASVG